MKLITSKIEFDTQSAILCGRMGSLDSAERKQAAEDAGSLLANLSKFLLNSPHCAGEIRAIKAFIRNIKTNNRRNYIKKAFSRIDGLQQPSDSNATN